MDVRQGTYLLLLTLAACRGAGQPPVATPGQARSDHTASVAIRTAHLDPPMALDDLLAADAALSAATRARGLVAGFVGGLTEDAVYLQPGRPIVRGRAVIRGLLTVDSLQAAGLSWIALRGEVSADGRDGYTTGAVRIELPDGGVQHGKYLAYWRRDAAGEWRIAAYLRNASPAPEALPPGFPAPGPNTHAVPADPAVTRRALVAADAEFAAHSERAGMAAAFAAYAAPDAILVLDRAPSVYGAEAIGAARRGPPTRDELRWVPLHADAAGSGDLGFTVGEAVYTRVPESGQPVRIYSKYLSIWKRQPGGEWRYVADGGNGRPEP